MSESPPKVEKPKRRWRKRLLWFFAILLLILWTINGPAARWAIAHFLDSALEKKDLSGETSVTGTILSGFSLHDFSYQGDQGIQQISFTKASVSYESLRFLSKGQISNISLTAPTVVIDLEKFPPSESERSPLNETIEKVQKLVSQQAFSIREADITLLKSTQLFAHFSFTSFDHAADSANFTLQNFQAQDGAGNTTPQQDITLTWNPSSVEIPHFEVLPDITLETAQIDWTQALTANASVTLHDATFQVNLADRLSATLTKGTLDTESLSSRFQLALPFSATLSHFDTSISNWKEKPQNWEVTLSSTFPTFNFEDNKLTETQLNFTQKDLSYTLGLSSKISDTPCEVSIHGDWLNPQAEQWWASTKASYSVFCKQLSNLPSQFFEVPSELNTAQTSVSAKGDFSVIDLALESITSALSIDGLKLKETPLPSLSAQLDYQHLESASIDLKARTDDHSPLQLNANYRFEDDTFAADFSIKEDQPEWVNQLLKVLEIDLVFKDAIDIEWNGTGTSDFTFDQKGTLAINQLKAKTSTVEPIEVTASVNYQWPESVQVTQLVVKEQNYTASCQLDWDQENLTVHNGSLLEKDKEIANFQAQIPYNLRIKTPLEFFNQESPWSAAIHSTPLSIPQLRKWFKLEDVEALNGLEGSTAFSLQVTGSPRHPHINGVSKLENLRGISNQDLAALHMFGTFASLNDELYFSGELLEATDQRATLNLKLPFTPHDWFNSDEELNELLDKVELSGEANINQLPLNRASRFVKQLKELKGQITGSAKLSGTVADPQIELETQIKIPKLVIAGFEVDDIRDIEINCKADQDRNISADLKASINGGEFTSVANIDFTKLDAPVFDIGLKTNHAMVFRNDSISMRANADLRLSGTLEDTTLSGKVGLVESLFYKDIDILPIGVPSSAVADVELPALNSSKLLPDIPAPFDQWKLDVTLSFDDPLLIRGNLAGGQIEGKVKAGGTLGAPNLDGSIIARDITARLPFSELKIKKGFAHFNAESGIIPTLSIQGSSTIGNYDTSIFVYGPATSPKTTFTSTPPLPKNDIMTLLATGVTSSALSNNKEVATLRALQLFLVKLRQESGDSRGTKVLAKILGGVQDFELNINETDHFTGRKFSSAKANINKRLYFTAQIDGKKQTRGLLVYVIRSR